MVDRHCGNRSGRKVRARGNRCDRGCKEPSEEGRRTGRGGMQQPGNNDGANKTRMQQLGDKDSTDKARIPPMVLPWMVAAAAGGVGEGGVGG